MEREKCNIPLEQIHKHTYAELVDKVFILLLIASGLFLVLRPFLVGLLGGVPQTTAS